MDSEHRHELKENDLATAIASAKDWWGKHQMKVLTAAVVLAALILSFRWFTESARNSRDNEQYELATAPGPDAFRALADATDNEAVELQANLRGGDAVLLEVRKPSTGVGATPADKKKQFLEAGESMYKKVLADGKHPLVRIKAHMGLAAVAETRGQWDKAREHYEAAQKEGGPGYEYLTKRAAAFAAALPKIKVEPVYGRVEKELPKTTDPLKLFEPDKDGKSPLPPETPSLFPEKTPAKDGKTPDPTKDGKAPAPEKDAKTPTPTPKPTPTPAKDAKSPAPTPEKDAKPAPSPAPEKDAKPAPEKDAKSPTP